MSTHPYTEDHLVEQPAIELFADLGWQTVAALEETFGTSPPAPLQNGEGSVLCSILPLSEPERG